MNRIVSYDEVANVKNTPGVYLIEIREKHELDETGVIPSSIHIPQCFVNTNLLSAHTENIHLRIENEEFKIKMLYLKGNVCNELTNLDAAAFLSKYNVSKPSLDSFIIFTCRSGRRAEKAMYDLEKMGYTNCKYYAGSWLEWESKHKQ